MQLHCASDIRNMCLWELCLTGALQIYRSIDRSIIDWLKRKGSSKKKRLTHSVSRIRRLTPRDGGEGHESSVDVAGVRRCGRVVRPCMRQSPSATWRMHVTREADNAKPTDLNSAYCSLHLAAAINPSRDHCVVYSSIP